MFDNVKKGMSDAKLTAIKNAIKDSGIEISDLKLDLDGEKLTIAGAVGSEENRKKIIELVKKATSLEAITNNLSVSGSGGSVASAGGGTAGGKSYTVASGDTLSGIAQKFYGNAGDYMKIYEANKAVIGGDPNLIKVGQVLTIP